MNRPPGIEWADAPYAPADAPEGAPLLRDGRLLAGRRDASFVSSPGTAWAVHVAVVSHRYAVAGGVTDVAAACAPGRVALVGDFLTVAADVHEPGRCRRRACATLYARADAEALDGG